MSGFVTNDSVYCSETAMHLFVYNWLLIAWQHGFILYKNLCGVHLYHLYLGVQMMCRQLNVTLTGGLSSLNLLYIRPNIYYQMGLPQHLIIVIRHL